MGNKLGTVLSEFIRKHLFKYTLFIKGFDGIVEIVVGTGLLIIHPDVINRVIFSYVQDELLEEPNDRIANYFLQHGHISSHQAVFTSLLLLARGVVKIFVIIGLLQKRLWVYPTAIAIFSIFAIVELYTFSSSHSLFLLALCVFDLFVIALTYREFNLLKRGQKKY